MRPVCITVTFDVIHQITVLHPRRDKRNGLEGVIYLTQTDKLEHIWMVCQFPKYCLSTQCPSLSQYLVLARNVSSLCSKTPTCCKTPASPPKVLIGLRILSANWGGWSARLHRWHNGCPLQTSAKPPRPTGWLPDISISATKKDRGTIPRAFPTENKMLCRTFMNLGCIKERLYVSVTQTS